MKKIYLLFIFIGLVAFACMPSDRAVLTGSVDSYKGEGHLIFIANMPEGQQRDTLTVQADGKFEYSTSFEKPVVVYLLLEYLNNDATIVNVYMANGKKNKVTITSSTNEAGRIITDAEYAGDYKLESEYLQTYFNLLFKANPDLNLETVATFENFKEYQAYAKEKMEPLHSKLNQVRNAEFKASNIEKLNTDDLSVAFRYAWSRRLIDEPMDADADFVAFVQSIDLNNPANLQITDMVIRWHLEVNKNTEKFSANRMKLMKTMVDNQEVINELSNKIMQIELTVGSKDLAATFEQYKQTSTDTEAIEKFSITYNQLVKLAKGAPASDFEMKDVKGNTVRFLEVVGKGKVVYIDFWASWCGPCKQEIPYVEKLVEKYKGNPNIEFISISLDHKLDNWHAQLDHDKPTWRQFIIPDNFNSTFAKEYNIQAIPRFMVFDKKGRIIDIGALRPSDPNIDAFLEACMK